MVVFAAVSLFACKQELKRTSVSVTDNHRHYYPVLRGKKLLLDYEIENTGEYPLVISEIQTTCGCITTDEGRKIVPAGKKIRLNFEYNSSKNLGYVEHEILLYGNFDSTNVYRLYFDVNVVPNADYTRDYEEFYEEEHSKWPLLKESDRKEGRQRRNYYVESEMEE